MHSVMNERDRSPSPEEFDARLRAAREEADAVAGRRSRRAATGSGLGVALRIGVELVAALIVGGGIGFLLDRWLGTAPWLLVVFFLLGAGAGIVNVYRVMVGLGQSVGYPDRNSVKDTNNDTGGSRD